MHLEGLRSYLIGPIEFISTEGAVKWRIQATKALKEMGITVYDPTNKPSDFAKEVGEEKERIIYLKETQQWDKLNKIMKDIVRADLRAVDHSDFIVAYMPKDVPMWGTIHEAVVARTQRKPVYTFIEQPIEGFNSWATYILGYDNIYQTLDEVLSMLKNKKREDLSFWFNKEK